jgi:hypothetical protein
MATTTFRQGSELTTRLIIRLLLSIDRYTAAADSLFGPPGQHSVHAISNRSTLAAASSWIDGSTCE